MRQSCSLGLLARRRWEWVGYLPDRSCRLNDRSTGGDILMPKFMRMSTTYGVPDHPRGREWKNEVPSSQGSGPYLLVSLIDCSCLDSIFDGHSDSRSQAASDRKEYEPP